MMRFQLRMKKILKQSPVAADAAVAEAMMRKAAAVAVADAAADVADATQALFLKARM